MPKQYDDIVDLILEDDQEMASQYLLMEAEEEDMLRKLNGETTLMDYMLLFLGYLEDRDCFFSDPDGLYASTIVGQPRIEKFWAIFYLHVPKKADLRGFKRVINDKEAQNQIQMKKLEDGSCILKIKILKRTLDALEKRDKDRAEQLSREDMADGDTA